MHPLFINLTYELIWFSIIRVICKFFVISYDIPYSHRNAKTIRHIIGLVTE